MFYVYPAPAGQVEPVCDPIGVSQPVAKPMGWRTTIEDNDTLMRKLVSGKEPKHGDELFRQVMSTGHPAYANRKNS